MMVRPWTDAVSCPGNGSPGLTFPIRTALVGFADSRAEKPARATFYSAVIRAMGKDTILIADGMNYIKGSRYQMYCQAREVSVRTCTVSGGEARGGRRPGPLLTAVDARLLRTGLCCDLARTVQGMERNAAGRVALPGADVSAALSRPAEWRPRAEARLT